MSKQEEAKIILETLDIHAPTNINWNLEDMWIRAIVKGLEAIQREESKADEP